MSCIAQSGFLNLQQDSRIDMLVNKQRQIYANDSTIDGFRVQIFMELGNNAVRHADSIKNKFIEKHPGTPIYLIFGQPYYRLRVGDFRTRLEAENEYQQLKKEYANSFVTADRINLPYNPLDYKSVYDGFYEDSLNKKVFIEEEDFVYDTILIDSLYIQDSLLNNKNSIYYEDNE